MTAVIVFPWNAFAMFSVWFSVAPPGLLVHSATSSGNGIRSSVGLPENQIIHDSQSNIYRIMIDAGSTGTRLHLFAFRWEEDESGLTKKRLILVNEDLLKQTPGLSSYAKHPKEAAKSLKPLLIFAKKHIPKKYLKKRLVPIELHATAGLRLLPNVAQDIILNEVRSFLKRKYSFFPMTKGEDEAVKIISGTDEGLYGWLTISFLTGDIFQDDSPIASLDLGGASTQVTFETKGLDPVECGSEHNSHEHKFLGKKHRLYTHSYLGLGIMRARHNILEKSSNPDDKMIVKSPCFHPNATVSWSYQGPTFEISGAADGEYSFAACSENVKKVLDSFKLCQKKELLDRSLYLMSYYYDRAQNIGLIKQGEYSKKLTVADYLRIANDGMPFTE